MMRKGCSASAGLLLLASAVVQAKDFGTLKFATEAAYPPFNQSTPSGKIVGYERYGGRTGETRGIQI